MRTHHIPFALDGSGQVSHSSVPIVQRGRCLQASRVVSRQSSVRWSQDNGTPPPVCLLVCYSDGHGSTPSLLNYARVFLGVLPASSVYTVAHRSGPVAYIVKRCKQSGYVVLHTLITLAKHKHSYPVQVHGNYQSSSPVVGYIVLGGSRTRGLALGIIVIGIIVLSAIVALVAVSAFLTPPTSTHTRARTFIP